MLMFPFGNPNAVASDAVAIYLDYADGNKSDSWHVCAQFALVISNPIDPKIYVVSCMSSLPSTLTIGALAYSDPPLFQMHTTDSTLKSPTGASRDSSTLGRSTTRKMGNLDRSSRMTEPKLASLSGLSKTQQACYGTAL
jgi:hypothetical protein